MKIGVVREIKTDEHRVALTPAGARELVRRGHDVVVETGAGLGSAFADDAYVAAGARIASVDDTWAEAELLLKVKEPIAAEYPRLRDDLVLFTYLHLAADEPLTRALVDSGVAAVAYETVETEDRQLPLLAPMSEVAGRLATQMGAGRSRSRRAVAASCSAACRACRRRRCSSSAAASSATTRRSSPWACRPTSGCSTSPSSACATSR